VKVWGWVNYIGGAVASIYSGGHWVFEAYLAKYGKVTAVFPAVGMLSILLLASVLHRRHQKHRRLAGREVVVLMERVPIVEEKW